LLVINTPQSQISIKFPFQKQNGLSIHKHLLKIYYL